jgi:hypothetical protein
VRWALPHYFGKLLNERTNETIADSEAEGPSHGAADGANLETDNDESDTGG